MPPAPPWAAALGSPCCLGRLPICLVLGRSVARMRHTYTPFPLLSGFKEQSGPSCATYLHT